MPTAIADTRKCGSGNHGRPNVLVIMTDDQAQTDVSLMPQVERRLAARGTTFADAVDMRSGAPRSDHARLLHGELEERLASAMEEYGTARR